jgi:hypothetical protein
MDPGLRSQARLPGRRLSWNLTLPELPVKPPRASSLSWRIPAAVFSVAISRCSFHHGGEKSRADFLGKIPQSGPLLA